MKLKPLKSLCEYSLLIVPLKVLSLLPYAVSEKIIVSLFIVGGINLGIRKKIAFEQLKHTFDDKRDSELRLVLKRTYHHFASLAADLFLKNHDKQKQITVDGWENITGALSLGRGLMLVSGHIGNWELAGRYIARRKVPVSVVIKELHNRYVNELINSIRMKHGIKIIYKKKALKPVLRAFKNNETVVTLIDQDAGKQGIKDTFLNKDASLFTGFVRLAMRNDTPLVLGIALKNKDCSYHFIFERPIIPSQYKIQYSCRDNDELEFALARYFHNRLEHYIRLYPEQWFWLHNRWKRAHKAKIV